VAARDVALIAINGAGAARSKNERDPRIPSHGACFMTSALTLEQLRDFARRLAEREHQLAREIADKTQELERDSEDAAEAQAIDDEERRVARTQRLLERAERSRDAEELAAVRAARQRLDAGSYGRCLQCGDDIDAARLAAQPAAARCARCQTDLERSQHVV
jgi:RNA polymerase-binding transcription factor DksA